jgi:hypothetical protein
VLLYMPDRGYVYEHVIVAENVLGKRLPDKAIVHHVNGNPSDNRPANLVICQNHKYHMLLHRRQRAFDACGHANWVRCSACGVWSPPDEIVRYVRTNRTRYGKQYTTITSGFHPACYPKYRREQKRRRGERMRIDTTAVWSLNGNNAATASVGDPTSPAGAGSSVER